MTEDEAFLQDIVAHPDDDTPRLIYADWLDEHDRPKRAELIRVQCRLARMSEDDPDHLPLTLREQALLQERGETWQEEFFRAVWGPDLPDDTECQFRRGFVEGLDLNAQDFLDKAETLFRISPLFKVRLNLLGVSRRGPGLFTESLLSSPHLSRLRTLDLSTNELGPVEALALAECPFLGNLQALDLDANEIGAPCAAALIESPDLATLTRLELSDLFLARDGVELLASLPQLSRFSVLGLSGVSEEYQDGDQIAEVLAESPHLRVRNLRLAGNGVGDRGAQALADSPFLENLTELWIYQNNIGPEGAAALVASPRLGRLTRLDLGKNQLGPEAMARLAALPQLARFQELVLYRSPLGDQGPTALAGSPHLTQMLWLDLRNCEIGAAGAAALGACPSLGRLRRLRLDSNPIGDEGAERLAGSARLPGLLSLQLSSCGISDAGALALLRLPGPGRASRTHPLGKSHQPRNGRADPGRVKQATRVVATLFHPCGQYRVRLRPNILSLIDAANSHCRNLGELF